MNTITTTTTKYNNPLICEAKRDVKIIKANIKSLQSIIGSKDSTAIEITAAQKEIAEWNDQKLTAKNSLKRIKTEIAKAELEAKSKGLEDRLVTDITQNNQEIANLEVEIERLTNNLSVLNLLKEDGFKEATIEIETTEKELNSKKGKIEELKKEGSPAWLTIQENAAQQEKIKAQITNLEETTILKSQLNECKRRLKTLHIGLAGKVVDNSTISKEEEAIKAEMKNIIKDIIHSESYLKIKIELSKAQDTLATLEFLKSEANPEVSESEIINTKKQIEELEIQINDELNKIKLQKELREAKAELINLEACIGIPGIEDVSNAISQLKSKITKLDNEIAEITTKSLNIIKPVVEQVTERTVAVTTTQTTTTTTTTITPAAPITAVAPTTPSSENSSAALMAQELQKWLAENMITEGIKADINEVIVTAALLNLTGKTLTPSTAQSAEESSTQNKIKALAIGACEKFCMTQVLQYLVTQNPIYSAVYGMAILANHCIWGDGQLSTLVQKIKSFTVAESIKFAGTALLGGFMAGGLAPVAAGAAGVYLTYNVGSQLKNKISSNKDKEKEKVQEKDKDIATTQETTNPAPVQHLAAAAMDMVADLTVASIYSKICG